MSNSNICSVYATNPLLKGWRTKADLEAINVYCNFAQNMPYGPIPDAERINQRPCNCPFGYGYSDNAYNFSAGPGSINLNQSANYRMYPEQRKEAVQGMPYTSQRTNF